MQSNTADFAPVPPLGKLDQPALSDVRLLPLSGELDKKDASFLTLAHSL